MVIPARPYKPRDKAKVEVGRAARRALDHRGAASSPLHESQPSCNEVIAGLVERVNDKPFKKLAGIAPFALRRARSARATTTARRAL